MKHRFAWTLTLLGSLLLAGALPTSASAASKQDEARADIRKATTETLNTLYKTQPSARNVISKSAGYAVFSNFGMKIFLAGGGSGKGLAVNNKSKAETFMKMVEVQAGLGIGIKKFRLVWVFQNKSDFDAFVSSGWELGAQAGATAKTGDKGGGLEGAVSIKPGVYLYQITDDGLAAELTAKGTKYYKDDDLN
ncbi:MAG: YSC84-related protein [Gammaproteobacteria bacterium]